MISINYNGKLGKIDFKYVKNILVSLGFLFVVAGLGIFNSPWWSDVILHILKINKDGKNDVLLAISLIIIGFICFLINYWIAENEKKRLQDKLTITTKGLHIQELNEYFDQLLADHSYYSSKDTIFYNSYNDFTDCLLQDKTKKLYSTFHDNAKKLHQFLSMNFFVYPDIQPSNDYRYCMQPELNIDRGGYDTTNRYNTLSQELKTKVDSTSTAYNIFIKHLRKNYIL